MTELRMFNFRTVFKSIFAGVILYSSFIWSSWVLVLFSLAWLYRLLIDQPLKARFWIVLSFGLGFFVPLLRWIAVLGTDAHALLVLLCLSFFIFLALTPVEANSTRGKIEFAIIWAAIELLRSNFPWGGFSWGLLSYPASSSWLAQYAKIGGSTLVAIVSVLVATNLAELWKQQTLRKLVLMVVAYLLAVVLPSPPVGDSLKVGIVQSGVVGSEVSEYLRPAEVLRRQIAQTVAHKETLREADFVLWPENSVNLTSFQDSAAFQIQNAVDVVNKPFIIGVVLQRADEAPRNLAVLWQPKLGPTASYAKKHLVPFGEYLPLRNLLASRISRFDQIPADFAAGSGGSIVEVGGHKIGLAICFEVADQDHLQQLVQGGAELLVTLSNNATYVATNQPAQQFQISRFSSLAHQRSMVIATTTGTSGVIASNGQIVSRIGHNEGAAIVSEVDLVNGKTFADRNPLRLGLILVVLAGLCYLERISQFVQRRRGAASRKDSADRVV